MKVKIISSKNYFDSSFDMVKNYPVLKEFNFREEDSKFYIDIDRVDELAYLEENIGCHINIDTEFTLEGKLFILYIRD